MDSESVKVVWKLLAFLFGMETFGGGWTEDQEEFSSHWVAAASAHLSGCFRLLEIPWEIVPFYGTASMRASTLKNEKIAKDGDSSSWLP